MKTAVSITETGLLQCFLPWHGGKRCKGGCRSRVGHCLCQKNGSAENLVRLQFTELKFHKHHVVSSMAAQIHRPALDVHKRMRRRSHPPAPTAAEAVVFFRHHWLEKTKGMSSMQLPCLGGGSRIRFRCQRLFEQVPFCRAARTCKLRDPFSEHYSREAPHVCVGGGGQMMFGVWFIFSFNTWNARGPQGHEKRKGHG